MTHSERHAQAADLGWKSCGDCVLDDCCGAISQPLAGDVGVIRCTKPFGHAGSDHVACFSTEHHARFWVALPRFASAAHRFVTLGLCAEDGMPIRELSRADMREETRVYLAMSLETFADWIDEELPF